MSEKNSVKVLIGGKVFTLSGYEGREYLEHVAQYMNRKLEELSTLGGWRRMSSDDKSTLLSLNIADDYYKAKKQADELEEEILSRDRELISLRQELALLQVRLDNMKKEAEKR